MLEKSARDPMRGFPAPKRERVPPEAGGPPYTPAELAELRGEALPARVASEAAPGPDADRTGGGDEGREAGAPARRAATSPPEPAGSLPAVADPNRQLDGKFAPGNRVNPAGRPKGRSLAQEARAMLGVPAGAWLGGVADAPIRAAAAAALGVEPEDVPADVTLGQLLLAVLTARAAGGSIEHVREILDRTDPKPQRITLDATVSPGRAAVASRDDAEAEAAGAYYDTLSES